VGYVPRGPVVERADAELVHSLLRSIDQSAKERRALYTIVEPDKALPLNGRFREHGFVHGPEHVQPGRTVKVPLLDDDALLKQMNQNTRYSVRLALRRGVQVVPIGDRYGIDDFYNLLTDTADRNRFSVHSREYYDRFLSIFADDARCIFAEADGHLAAGLITAKFGDEAIYMYGASSSQHRGHGAAFLLQFEAMRWAREAGCERYDLWGIPMVDPTNVTDTGTTIAGTRGDDWRGLYRFKTGFGGEIVSYPPTLERRYSLLGSFVARRLLGQQRGDS
jgi:lipid II:glycine glycyltransferase (peptidoglycan interpeptide bridge formation enzyme)